MVGQHVLLNTTAPDLKVDHLLLVVIRSHLPVAPLSFFITYFFCLIQFAQKSLLPLLLSLLVYKLKLDPLYFSLLNEAVGHLKPARRPLDIIASHLLKDVCDTVGTSQSAGVTLLVLNRL